MGISKAMMEKVAIAKSRENHSTTICVTRYGNVMGSRGSVIPLFVDQILAGNEISITDPSMTRFMMTLDDAVNLVIYAFEHGKSGEIFIQKAPAATIDVLVKSLTELYGFDQYPTKIIGTRHGEKLYEVLLSREEMAVAEETSNYFRVSPDCRDLNYGAYTDLGDLKITNAQEYSSHNTERLDVGGMTKLLRKLGLDDGKISQQE
jgi:UDP-glucose 4-epimerase